MSGSTMRSTRAMSRSRFRIRVSRHPGSSARTAHRGPSASARESTFDGCHDATDTIAATTSRTHRATQGCKGRRCEMSQSRLRLVALVSFVSFVPLASFVIAQGARKVALGDWPEARGPNRDGVSQETGLVDRWTLNGENFLWRAPYGGRSAPVVMGNRVYLQNPAGRGAAMQERVMALDADTGRLVWEYRFNVFQSHVPTHRAGW